ncbi:MAG: hypothetical protein JWN84_712 [Nocardioides sp.]|jgi:lipoprotein LprG|nr:hypothetical protein [Nocardioides sp.]
MPILHRTTAAAALVLAASLGLSACSDDDGSGSSSTSEDVSPEESLAAAKTVLDGTSGVELTLATDDTPDSEAYLTEATGVITADPEAFEGTASGTFEGVPASDVEIVSVGGQVYAQIFGGFQDFDLPKCVPDPAGLLDPTSGFGAVLTEATQVSRGEAVRGGADNDEILTPYSATVPGAAVQNLLPCAPGAEFLATFNLDDDGRLRTADLTGEFFEGGSELTYTVAIDAYDVEQEITKP